MAYDPLADRWKEIRPRAKSWWGVLTDDDLDRIQGQRDTLVGMLQEKYGLSRAQAIEEIDRHMRDYERKQRHLR